MTTVPGGLTRITSVTRTVPDLDAAVRFYHDGLGLEPGGSASEVPGPECALLGVTTGRAFRLEMRLQRQHVTLLHFAPQGRAYPSGSTASDLWFQHSAVVVGDMAHAHERVMKAGAVPITQGGPQRLPANTGGVTAFKFRDPFGHPWELLGLPGSVGDPLWHRADPAPFLGIDHTAIAVSGGDPSRRFYTEVLGLAVIERTHNRGAAQTRLDAVPDDDVDVTALSPAETPPHLELLAYRTGTRRRLAASDPTDGAVTHTIAACDIDAIARRLSDGEHNHANLRHGAWNGRPAIAFRDPDGHGWICGAA